MSWTLKNICVIEGTSWREDERWWIDLNVVLFPWEWSNYPMLFNNSCILHSLIMSNNGVVTL